VRVADFVIYICICKPFICSFIIHSGSLSMYTRKNPSRTVKSLHCHSVERYNFFDRWYVCGGGLRVTPAIKTVPKAVTIHTRHFGDAVCLKSQRLP
jgi:hypothetical protein